MSVTSMTKVVMALGGGSFKQKPSSRHFLQIQLTVNSRTMKKQNGALSFHVDAPSAKEGLLSLRRDEWRELLASLKLEEQINLLELVPRRMDPLELGGVVMGDAIIKQSFPIRSYEVGADEKASIETLLRHLQETSLSQVREIGLLADGFGATPEMSKRGLIWVFTKMQVLVEKYPTWGDVVEVESWVNEHGKNALSRDWHIRDCTTGETIARAIGVLVMMNKSTRKLSKIPEEVRNELRGIFVDRERVIVEEQSERIPKLDVSSTDFVREGLTPQWSDLDANQHVNNVKYISWILESVPEAVVEKYDLAGMTLEYRRECHRDSVLRSFTSIVDDSNSGLSSSSSPDVVECNHLLLLQDGAEILRGHTQWKPKKTKKASLPLYP